MTVLQAEAQRAAGRGEPLVAEAMLGRALDEPLAPAERGVLLARLGELRAGRSGAEAVELLERALELIEGRHDRVDALRALGDALVADGRHAEGGKAIQAGLRLAGDHEPELTRRLNASHVMLGAVRPELAVDAEPSSAATAVPSPLITTEERAELVATAARGCFELLPHTECLALARRALDGDRLQAGDGPDAHRWAVAKAVLVWSDDLDAALTVCDAALEQLRRRGNPIGVATASACRATPAFWTGRLDEAAGDAERALAVREAGWQPWFGLAGTVLVTCHLEHDDVTTAAAVLEEVQRRAGDAPEFVAYARFARARLREAEGRTAEALADFLAAGAAMPHPNPSALPWRSYAAQLAARRGDRERGLQLAAEELGLARDFGAPRAIGMALRALGGHRRP